MEQLENGYTLHIAPGTFPLSTDSIALSQFARLPKQARVLDLGSGCGTLGMLLCAKDATCSITGMEITPLAHEAACANIAANGLSGRLSSICGDLRSIPHTFPAGSFTTCISNPPYFSGGAQSRENPQARRNDLCSTEELFHSAGWALQWGGDFYLVHKPEYLAQLCACASKENLEPKRLRLLRHSPGKPVSLVLLACRKGGKPGLIWEENCLFDETGAPTAYYQTLYHI